MQKKDIEGSRFGLWDDAYNGYEGGRKLYGNDIRTATIAAKFLGHESVFVIEDWGCGYGGFKKLIAPHQQYIGVDGSRTPFADKFVDLTSYRSAPDGILLRHVLEHNPRWFEILRNALSSFKKRMVIVIFTPFVEETKIVGRYPSWRGSARGVDMLDIAFNKEEILREFGDDVIWTESSVQSESQYGSEHIFFFRRPGEPE